MKKYLLYVIPLLAVACTPITNVQISTPTPISNAQTISAPTPDTNTAHSGTTYPNPHLTPGAVLAVTTVQICTPGYSHSVRNVPFGEKQQVYINYGITLRQSGQYEVDHLISLELGGSNAIANLWPEAAEPRPGFHEKDRYENYLHQQVCKGTVSLAEAQRRIVEDWLKYWVEAGQP